MKKFFFSLDTVLNYKEQVLDSVKAEHMKILVKMRNCEAEIEALEESYKNIVREFDEKKYKGMEIHEIYVYDNFLRSIRQQLAQKQAELSQIKREEEKRRARVVEAKKESSSLIKLKEKQYEFYNKQVQKENEQLIEDFVSTKSAFAKLNG